MTVHAQSSGPRIPQKPLHFSLDTSCSDAQNKYRDFSRNAFNESAIRLTETYNAAKRLCKTLTTINNRCTEPLTLNV